jgi:hypothetical protein
MARPAHTTDSGNAANQPGWVRAPVSIIADQPNETAQYALGPQRSLSDTMRERVDSRPGTPLFG